MAIRELARRDLQQLDDDDNGKCFLPWCRMRMAAKVVRQLRAFQDPFLDYHDFCQERDACLYDRLLLLQE